MNLSAFLGAVLFAILLAGLWIYKIHPEAFQDAIADISNDPNGVRAQLAKAKLHQTRSSVDKRDIPSTASSTAPSVTPPTTDAPAVVSTPNPSETPDTALTFVPPNPLPAQPNWTWTTSDGRVYKSVIVQSVDADCVTILDSDGGARVDIALLPADIQKQLNYNPALAKEAAEKRAVELVASKEATIAEKQAIQENQKHMGLDQAQATVNIHQAEVDAERRGQIVVLGAQIIEFQSDIERNERTHPVGLMSPSALAADTADRDRLKEMKDNLSDLKKQEAAAVAAATADASK